MNLRQESVNRGCRKLHNEAPDTSYYLLKVAEINVTNVKGVR